MDKKHVKLPKEGIVEPEEARRTGFIDAGDVEGHGMPTTAPPSIGSHRSPGHGGENIPMPVDDEDDVEGHRRRTE
jgi:hypothetical protein